MLMNWLLVRRRLRCVVRVLGVCLLVLCGPTKSVQETWGQDALEQEAAPLHQQIDQLIAQADPEFAQGVSKPASDAEFLRRVYLDLTGRIPTAAQARMFFADSAAGKRASLIDQLFASPQHARHL